MKTAGGGDVEVIHRGEWDIDCDLRVFNRVLSVGVSLQLAVVVEISAALDVVDYLLGFHDVVVLSEQGQSCLLLLPDCLLILNALAKFL